MPTNIQLFDKEVEDEYARENFVRIRRFVQDDTWIKGQFSFFELALTKASAGATYPATLAFAHSLNFKPKDVVQLSITPDTVTTTWKYDSFTRTHVSVIISAACTVRVFIGRYEEN